MELQDSFHRTPSGAGCDFTRYMGLSHVRGRNGGPDRKGAIIMIIIEELVARLEGVLDGRSGCYVFKPCLPTVIDRNVPAHLFLDEGALRQEIAAGRDKNGTFKTALGQLKEAGDRQMDFGPAQECEFNSGLRRFQIVDGKQVWEDPSGQGQQNNRADPLEKLDHGR